jgi:hypothetical protein
MIFGHWIWGWVRGVWPGLEVVRTTRGARQSEGDNEVEKTATKENQTRPCSRGYHTINVIGDTMVIISDSDGKDCFSEVWLGLRPFRLYIIGFDSHTCLETRAWTQFHAEPRESYKLLAHSATSRLIPLHPRRPRWY